MVHKFFGFCIRHLRIFGRGKRGHFSIEFLDSHEEEFVTVGKLPGASIGIEDDGVGVFEFLVESDELLFKDADTLDVEAYGIAVIDVAPVHDVVFGTEPLIHTFSYHCEFLIVHVGSKYQSETKGRLGRNGFRRS